MCSPVLSISAQQTSVSLALPSSLACSSQGRDVGPAGHFRVSCCMCPARPPTASQAVSDPSLPNSEVLSAPVRQAIVALSPTETNDADWLSLLCSILCRPCFYQEALSWVAASCPSVSCANQCPILGIRTVCVCAGHDRKHRRLCGPHRPCCSYSTKAVRENRSTNGCGFIYANREADLDCGP